MWKRFCRWVGIRLIMSLKGRKPDLEFCRYGGHPVVTRRDGPIFRRWDLIPDNPVFNIALREWSSPHYATVSRKGISITLLGWYRHHLWNPRRVVLREQGSVVFRNGRVDIPMRGKAWLLTFQIGR
jgi:hypothetical protein